MRIEPVFLDGPAGRIECMIKHPSGGQASEPPPAAAVVCHPHPLFGGTMHNKVVHAAAGALSRAGLPVLRFNFRGVGLSEGRHDTGHGEQDDVRAVLDYLAGRFPAAPILVAGYSFGAFAGLKAGSGADRVSAMIGIGLPVSLYDFDFLRQSLKPLSIIQGELDRFGPLADVMAFAATLPAGAKVIPVAGAGHGFDGRLEEVARGVAAAIPPELTSAPAPPPS
jgi:hypothetical protein